MLAVYAETEVDSAGGRSGRKESTPSSRMGVGSGCIPDRSGCQPVCVRTLRSRAVGSDCFDAEFVRVRSHAWTFFFTPSIDPSSPRGNGKYGSATIQRTRPLHRECPGEERSECSPGGYRCGRTGGSEYVVDREARFAYSEARTLLLVDHSRHGCSCLLLPSTDHRVRTGGSARPLVGNGALQSRNGIDFDEAFSIAGFVPLRQPGPTDDPRPLFVLSS